MELCLTLVNVSVPSAPGAGFSGAGLGESVEIAGVVWNQLYEKVFQHPGEPIVRHDPDAKPRATGVRNVQALDGDPFRQLSKLVGAPGSESLPTGSSVPIGVDDNTQGFKPRCPDLNLDNPWLQDLVDAAVRLDKHGVLRGLIRPHDAMRFHEVRNHALVRLALNEQLPGMVSRRQVT